MSIEGNGVVTRAARDERHTVLHSWCQQSQWAAPTVIGGSGARLLTDDGRSILDMSSLAECCNLGHQHPHLVAAIRRQAEQLCFVTSSWGAQPRAQLAEMLLEKSGFEGGRVFFTLAGADANENAVKIARQVAGKPRGSIITRDRSYHGASYATMALSGDTRTRHQVDPSAFGVIHTPPPYAYRCPFGSTTALDCGTRSVGHIGKVIDDRGTDAIAAVMMEPNAGTNGIVAPQTRAAPT
jgi:taurine---2-oxoglutarate transaminase